MSVKQAVLLSWNCRGLNNSITSENIKDLCRKSRANLLCLHETKCSVWNNAFRNQIWSDDLIAGYIKIPLVFQEG